MMFGIENSLFDKTAKLDKASRDAYNQGELLIISDGFELEFSGSSEPELKIFRAESSRAGAF